MMFLFQVKVGFLMEGHTHEDIDQVFSRVATWIRRKDMATLPDLVDNLRVSQQPAPVVDSFSCYDYKRGLEDCREPDPGHSGATPLHCVRGG